MFYIHNLRLPAADPADPAWSFRFSEGAREWKRAIRVGWSEIEAVYG